MSSIILEKGYMTPTITLIPLQVNPVFKKY